MMAIPTPAFYVGKQPIVIKPYPPKSPVCKRLVDALDAEVDILYPDWVDFPYEGPGNWFAGAPSPGSTSNGHSEEQTVEKRGQLVYFVAFPVDGNEQDVNTEDDAAAIGIIGVKLLPYFPSHWAPGTQVKDPSGRSSAENEPVTAEVKRLYVVPTYRGRGKVLLADVNANNQGDESVAGILMRHVEDFARKSMKVQRLVVETGCRQHAAMGFYERSGWTKRKEFGDYTGAGEESGGLSRCYEKWLST